MGRGTESTSLEEAIGFTTFDLQANRDGHISPAQHEQFTYQVNTAIRDTLIMLVLISLVAVFTRLYVAFVGLPGLLMPRWWVLRARWLDERDGRVLSMSGPAHIEIVGGTHGTEFHGIRIDGMLFDYAEITDLICRAFQEGVNYRVYYLPHSKKIVSAEAEGNSQRGNLDPVP